MSQDKVQAPREMKRLERQEEDTWVGFYPQACRDPTLAMEILTELERDDALRRRHRGLYLCCQRCIRLHESREARHRRIRNAIQKLFEAIFITLPLGVLELAKKAGHFALACIPEDARDQSSQQADQQARRLLAGDAYAHAERSFRDRARRAAVKAEVPAPVPGPAEDLSEQHQATTV
jgi:hypothetical protein